MNLTINQKLLLFQFKKREFARPGSLENKSKRFLFWIEMNHELKPELDAFVLLFDWRSN